MTVKVWSCLRYRTRGCGVRWEAPAEGKSVDFELHFLPVRPGDTLSPCIIIVVYECVY